MYTNEHIKQNIKPEDSSYLLYANQRNPDVRQESYQKRAYLRLGKRALLRLGKRAYIRLVGGQNYSNSVVTMDLITKEIKIAGQLLNGRKSHTSSRIDNHAYIWGGYCCKKIERYDVHTNKTQEIKCRLDNVIDSLSSVVHDSKLFQIGGFSCKKTIDTVKYLDFEKCAFINESKLIVPDMWHDSIVIDSNIYTTPGAYCKNIQRRDLRERNWQLMRKVIPNKTYRNAVCSLGQTNIVCIGGWNLDSEVYSDCFVFDIRADDWRQIEPLPKALKAAQACETTKEIIVFGGIQSDHTYDSCINEILCYDKNENTWTKLDQNLPFPNGWSTKVTF
uniref:BACK domain-containing protein n=1 Tax=Rhabditophanes sp. KR3021 TaxID=114890 RepID=A0AC35U4Y3_9BILA